MMVRLERDTYPVEVDETLVGGRTKGEGPSYPPMDDMKRTTRAGCSRNSWRSGLR